MTTLDSQVLALVTGGTSGAAPSPSEAEPAVAPSGNDVTAGLQQFLSFLQSPQFGQLVGGLQQVLSAFTGGSAPAASESSQAEG